VTRHGLPEPSAVAPSLRPIIEFAPSVVSDASKPPLAANPHRQRHSMQRPPRQIASHSASTNAGRDLTTLSRKQKYP
jgi:hypothetical protein